MKIKICGLKDPENIKHIAALKPDMMGFIFHPGSPRFAGDQLIIPPIHSSIKKAGVFVNAAPSYIIDMIGEHGLDLVQLHGNESPALCEVMSHLVGVIKAFGIDENFDFKTLAPYSESCSYFLFDTKTDLHGGSGQAFDRELLNGYDGSVPFLLSGGVGAEEISNFRPRIPGFAGFDLNSKFERSPGIKDIELLGSVLPQTTGKKVNNNQQHSYDQLPGR
ncbi:MAG: phosphoribosylanthranilate isomerase [Bacteroidia bacterium]